MERPRGWLLLGVTLRVTLVGASSWDGDWRKESIHERLLHLSSSLHLRVTRLQKVQLHSVLRVIAVTTKLLDSDGQYNSEGFITSGTTVLMSVMSTFVYPESRRVLVFAQHPRVQTSNHPMSSAIEVMALKQRDVELEHFLNCLPQLFIQVMTSPTVLKNKTHKDKRYTATSGDRPLTSDIKALWTALTKMVKKSD